MFKVETNINNDIPIVKRWYFTDLSAVKVNKQVMFDLY